MQGSIVYSVIGDFQASFYFGVDSDTGVITVRNDLLNDIVEDYTVRQLMYLEHV